VSRANRIDCCVQIDLIWDTAACQVPGCRLGNTVVGEPAGGLDDLFEGGKWSGSGPYFEVRQTLPDRV
jgi:hypothetical protein